MNSTTEKADTSCTAVPDGSYELPRRACDPVQAIVVPSVADVLAIAEHYGVAFVEQDGWVNALVTRADGPSTVYKAPTAAAVS